MSTRTPFQYAVPNPETRREICLAVEGGISVEQLAAEFDVAESTIRAYHQEWTGTQRKVQALTDFEREAIRAGCQRGARRRWERQYGAEVVRQVLGE